MSKHAPELQPHHGVSTITNLFGSLAAYSRPGTKGSRPVTKASSSLSRPSTRETGRRRHTSQLSVAQTAQSLYAKVLAKIEAEEDERVANTSTGFSRDTVDRFPEDPDDRDLNEINELVKQLRTTTFFEALPEERKESSFWHKVFREARLHRNLRAGRALYDASVPSVQSDHSSPQILSPNQQRARQSMMMQRSGTGLTAGPDKGFKTAHLTSKLFVILSGGVQVEREDSQVTDGDDARVILESGDCFGALCAEGLANPKAAATFTDETDVLEIDVALLRRAHEMQVMDHTRFLMSTRLFAETPRAFVEQLAPLLRLKRYNSNEVIVKQGDSAQEKEGLYIIVSGCARVVQEVIVPYAMAEHGYTRTPSETIEPVSSSAIRTLAHARQGRFGVGAAAQQSANAARKMVRKNVPRVTNPHQEQEELIQKEANEILSARGTFVSTMSRLAATRSHKAPTQHRKGAPSGHGLKAPGGQHDAPGTIDKNSRSLVVELRQLWKGSYFGELALINKAPRSASVIAMTPTTVFIMEKMDFHRQFDEKMLQWLRKLALENDYSQTEQLVGDSLGRETAWTEYRQTVFSSHLFKSSANSREKSERQSQGIMDALLADPAVAMGLKTRETHKCAVPSPPPYIPLAIHFALVPRLVSM